MRKNHSPRSIDVYIGTRLTELRACSGETVTSLARSLDVSPDVFRRWECGAERIPADRLIELATLLPCKISDFFGGLPELGMSGPEGPPCQP